MQVKRILVMVEQPGFDPLNRYSAVASVVYAFSSMLQENGYEVFINHQAVTSIRQRQANSGATVNVGKTSRLYKWFPKRMREMVKDVLLFRSLKQFEQDLQQVPTPDLIIGWISYGSSAAVTLSKKWNVPLVSIFDNPISEEYKFLFGFYPFFKRKVNFHEGRMIDHASAIITYSKAVEDYARKKHAPKASFWYKAFTDFKRMSFKTYDRPTEQVRFTYIGSFFNWHKVDDLIRTFVAIRKKGYDSQLVLVGDGPEFENIKQLVQGSGYASDIVFTGRLDSDALEQQIAKIHVGIIPNALFWQGPVKLFQYSAAQMPVICKATPSILSLTQRHEGYLYFDTAEQMQEQMLYILDHPQKIQDLGKQTQDFVKKNYDEKAYLELFREIFASIHTNTAKPK